MLAPTLALILFPFPLAYVRGLTSIISQSSVVIAALVGCRKFVPDPILNCI